MGHRPNSLECLSEAMKSAAYSWLVWVHKSGRWPTWQLRTMQPLYPIRSLAPQVVRKGLAASSPKP